MASLQWTAFAQDYSVPQTRLSSKGLAYVDLSTYPANPVTGHPTILLLKFVDPQTQAPRADIYYKLIIRNGTAPVFVLPGGSTIDGKVGIPYQFEKPGSYQVEVDLNDTDITQATTYSLDKVTFPLYVAKGEIQTTNMTLATNEPHPIPAVNTAALPKFNNHLWVDGVLIAAAVGIGILFFKRRAVSRKKGGIER